MVDKPEERPKAPEEPARAATARAKERRKKSRKAEYVGAIIINAILIFVFNNLLNWGVTFLTPDFANVLWAFNLSLGATIAGNFLLLLYDPARLRHFVRAILNVFGFIAVFTLNSVFPFDVSPVWQLALRIAFIVGMVAIGIAFIVELVLLALRKD